MRICLSGFVPLSLLDARGRLLAAEIEVERCLEARGDYAPGPLHEALIDADRACADARDLADDEAHAYELLKVRLGGF